MNLINNDEIPLGLSMALAKNIPAMERFASMDEKNRRQVIEKSRQVRSRQEMERLTASLTEPGAM